MLFRSNTDRLNSQLNSQTREEKDRFSADISFVGSMYHKNSYDDIKDKLPPYLRGYFDAAMLAQLNIYGDNIIDELLTVDILKQLSEFVDFRQDKRAFSDIRLVFESTFLGFKLANIERVRTLNLLAKKNKVALYTDEQDTSLINVDFKGTVDYMNDMPKVFNNSSINLNMTIRNIRTGIPLRVWDILGAGGFLLTNYQIELTDYFKNEESIVYYEDMYDCCKKAEYYLFALRPSRPDPCNAGSYYCYLFRFPSEWSLTPGRCRRTILFYFSRSCITAAEPDIHSPA